MKKPMSSKFLCWQKASVTFYLEMLFAERTRIAEISKAVFKTNQEKFAQIRYKITNIANKPANSFFANGSSSDKIVRVSTVRLLFLDARDYDYGWALLISINRLGSKLNKNR